MLRILFVAFSAFASVIASASAQDYGIEVLSAAPAAAEVSTELIEQFSSQGFKITRDSSETVCEIWLRSKIDIEAGFEQSEALLYPFKPKLLIGLIHFPRRSNDFRNQTVQSGWYTLRFELQPIDGNHVGTSPTRDFLLMVPAKKDQANKVWDAKELIAASIEVAGASHPAMICLQAVDKTSEKKLSIRHNAEKDWWIARLVGKGVADGKPQDVVLDLIVAGHAAE